MSEIAIVSARKARLQQWSNEGNHRAEFALKLANAPNRFLATVQVCITLLDVAASAYGGATIAEKLALRLEGLPYVHDYRGGLALAIVVAFITYVNVILGELVPKALALHNAERVASVVAWPMDLISRTFSPFVTFLGASTEAVLRLMGSKPSTEPPVTGDEINVMIAQGTEAGVFKESQQDMVESVIELHEKRISSIMTPRPEIAWLDVDATPDELREEILGNTHSRFPVCRGSLDEVLGIVHTKDMLSDCLQGRDIDLGAHLKKALTIPETIPVLKSLESFKESGIHTALIIDEYGSLQGLVTMNDILESIVGNIPSHEEKGSPEAVRREDGSWLVDGMQAIDDLKDLVGVDELPGEGEDTYQTLGGFVMTQLGRIPKAGDVFVQDHVRYEVMDMDGNRVDKVLVKREDPPAEPPGREEPKASDREG
jgi:putative hemolysin